MDSLVVKMHLVGFPKSYLNAEGYPHWKDHPKKEWLEVDAANRLYETMKQLELCNIRDEYKEFLADVFGEWVH